MRPLKVVLCLSTLALTGCMNPQTIYHPHASGSSTIQGTSHNGSFLAMRSASTTITAIDNKPIAVSFFGPHSQKIMISSGNHLISTDVTFQDGWMGSGYHAQNNILLHVKREENYTVEASHTKHHVQTWIVDSEGKLASKKINAIAMPLNAESVYVPPLPKN